MDNDPALDKALWRYGIISPLLHRRANDLLLCELLEDIARRTYVLPNGHYQRVQPDTIRKWLYRYNHGGLDALSDKIRCDKGKHDVPQSLFDAMADLRKEHPRWTLSLMLEQLIEDKVWNGRKPSRSVLYRFANANNLMRDPHLESIDIIRPFEFERFGQLWIADFMHGPRIRVRKKKRKVYLHVIIDDCTRWVVSGRFYTAENVESLIKELMIATRRFGLAQRLYTDNGSAYSSLYLKVVCARLGMQLSHTPAYRPQGRSKVERFFRTVRERFLAAYHMKTLDEINRKFIDFIEDYHNRRHSTLKCTPMQKRLGHQSACRQVPQVVDIESLFRNERRCRIYNDGTIRLKNRRFEVPGCLPGTRVTVYFMPWDLSRVYYGDEMRLAKPVDLNANAHRFDHPNFHK
jgi:transposase InsO family protein